MKIMQDAVVTLDFTLTDNEGEIIDSSEGEPLAYLHGHGQLVPGLERELTGHGVGDKLNVTVTPKDGYGETEEDLVISVDRVDLPQDMEPEVGMELTYDGPDDEEISMWVIEVGDKQVRLDGNHPLAGQTLHFAIDVRGIRVATAEEIEHGHAHGEGGDDGHDSHSYTH
jgi:FKBP-type peptidyl-prolyl cis-trans isomerase SlyD